MTAYRNTARRRREVAQILQRWPADDRLQETCTLYLEASTSLAEPDGLAEPAGRRFEGFKPQSRRRPVSLTGCRLQRMNRNLALRRSAYHDIAWWTFQVSDQHRSAPLRCELLLLLGGDLALGRCLLLRGGLRLRSFLHHVALLVRAEWWVSHQYLRES
jgi:hypothetical protein